MDGPAPDPSAEADRSPLWKRLLWLAAIWVGSVSILGMVAYGIRLWLKA
ncbi:DUF2474 domain-containing protein [Qipengyuania sp. JC766]